MRGGSNVLPSGRQRTDEEEADIFAAEKGLEGQFLLAAAAAVAAVAGEATYSPSTAAVGRVGAAASSSLPPPTSAKEQQWGFQEENK